MTYNINYFVDFSSGHGSTIRLLCNLASASCDTFKLDKSSATTSYGLTSELERRLSVHDLHTTIVPLIAAQELEVSMVLVRRKNPPT